MAKQAKNKQKEQKSIYLPKWIWDKLETRGTPNKQSINNVIELILEKELA